MTGDEPEEPEDPADDAAAADAGREQLIFGEVLRFVPGHCATNSPVTGWNPARFG